MPCRGGVGRWWLVWVDRKVYGNSGNRSLQPWRAEKPMISIIWMIGVIVTSSNGNFPTNTMHYTSRSRIHLNNEFGERERAPRSTNQHPVEQLWECVRTGGNRWTTNFTENDVMCNRVNAYLPTFCGINAVKTWCCFGSKGDDLPRLVMVFLIKCSVTVYDVLSSVSGLNKCRMYDMWDTTCVYAKRKMRT